MATSNRATDLAAMLNNMPIPARKQGNQTQFLFKRAVLAVETNEGEILVGLKEIGAKKRTGEPPDKLPDSQNDLAISLISMAEGQMEVASELSSSRIIITNGETVWIT